MSDSEPPINFNNMLHKIILSTDKYLDTKYEPTFKLIGKALGLLSIILVARMYVIGEITASTFLVIFSLVFSCALGFFRIGRLIRPSAELMRKMGAQVFNTSLPPYGQTGWLKIRLREFYYSVIHVVLADFFMVWILFSLIVTFFIFIFKIAK